MSNKFMTIAEAQKMLDPQGRMARAVDFFTQANEIMQVLLFTMCNKEREHLVTLDLGLPTVYVKQVNKGVVPSDAGSTQFFEPTAKWESWAEFDIDSVPPRVKPSEVMTKKSRRHREAHAQNFVYEMIYGNHLTDPDSIPGLSGRYSSLSGSNSQNIIDGGGTGGGCTSLWLVQIGEDGLHGLYPEGTMAGLQTKDKGIETKEAVNGTQDALSEVARAKFSFSGGIALENTTRVTRIPNLKVSAMVTETDEPDLIQLTEDAVHTLPSTNVQAAPGKGMPTYFLGNRTARKIINRQYRKAGLGASLPTATVDGVFRSMLHNIPLLTVDQILNTEDTVS